MKTSLLLFTVLLCVSCSSSQPPNYQAYNTSAVPIVTMQYESSVQQMSRNDVISAVLTCQSSGLLAEIVNGKRMINGSITSIPVDVVCLPKMDPYKW